MILLNIMNNTPNIKKQGPLKVIHNVLQIILNLLNIISKVLNIMSKVLNIMKHALNITSEVPKIYTWKKVLQHQIEIQIKKTLLIFLLNILLK